MSLLLLLLLLHEFNMFVKEKLQLKVFGSCLISLYYTEPFQPQSGWTTAGSAHTHVRLVTGWALFSTDVTWWNHTEHNESNTLVLVTWGDGCGSVSDCLHRKSLSSWKMGLKTSVYNCVQCVFIPLLIVSTISLRHYHNYMSWNKSWHIINKHNSHEAVFIFIIMSSVIYQWNVSINRRF